MSRISKNTIAKPKIINNVLVFDRDGIINLPVDNLKYPSDFHPIEHALETISFLRNSGAKIFIIFNEPSIAKKTVSIEDVDQVNNVLLEKLGQAGCMTIDGLYYSTSNFKEDLMSLPNTGMLKIAEQNSRISLKGGYVISDDIEHLKVAVKYQMKPVLILSGNGYKTQEKLNTFANRELKKRTKVFSSLSLFKDFLLQS